MKYLLIVYTLHSLSGVPVEYELGTYDNLRACAAAIAAEPKKVASFECQAVPVQS